MSEDRVQVEISDSGVATATMVRADKHNALDQAMFEGLMNAARQLAGDNSVRAVVLHGEGEELLLGPGHCQLHVGARRYRRFVGAR